MRWVVYGAGAIGGFVGGRLAGVGESVTLIARGPQLEALRTHGLMLRTPSKTEHAPVDVVGSPADVDWGEQTTVLLTVKSNHTMAALAELSRWAPSTTPICCMQNGVANEPSALQFFERVQGAYVGVSALCVVPGLVEAPWGPWGGIVDIGGYPRADPDVSGAISTALQGAGFLSLVRPDIMAWKYRKLLANLGTVVEACFRAGDDAEALSRRAVEEGERILRLAGIVPVAVQEQQARQTELAERNGVARLVPARGSSWQSLRRRSGTIETDYLNGEIVRLGRLLGRPTPVNEALQQTAARLARSRGEVASIDARDVLGRIEEVHD
jgi:2-dehydropantoate 2-reductase